MIHGRSISFISTRLLTACLGIARTIAVIRLLTLEQYAVVGIVEGIRALLAMVAGLGVADAFEREVSLEVNRTDIASLFRDALIFTITFCAFIGLALWACAPLVERLVNVPGVAHALTIAGFAILTERAWQLASALVRRVSGAVTYLRLVVANAAIGLVTSVGGVATFGVEGFFHALWFTSGLSCVLAWIVARDHVREVVFGRLRGRWTANMRRLWRLSWASFSYKATSIIWRRMPLVVCSGFIDERHVGAISVVLDLTWKLHILQQALSPLAVSRLAPIFKHRRPHYRSAALVELKEVVLWTGSALLIAVFAWEFGGWLVVGPERWVDMRSLFYLALAVDVTLFFANVAFVWILVPAGEPLRTSVPAIVVRLIAPFVVWSVTYFASDRTTAFLGTLAASGILAALLLWLAAFKILSVPTPASKPIT